jgi:hypothetical protein
LYGGAEAALQTDFMVILEDRPGIPARRRGALGAALFSATGERVAIGSEHMDHVVNLPG